MPGGKRKDSECSPREKKVVEYFIANPGASYQEAADFMGLSKNSIYKYMHLERVNALMERRLKEKRNKRWTKYIWLWFCWIWKNKKIK